MSSIAPAASSTPPVYTPPPQGGSAPSSAAVDKLAATAIAAQTAKANHQGVGGNVDLTV